MATDDQTTDQTATDETTDEQRDEALPEGLTDGGKAALVAEREARKKAAKEARETKAELQRLLDEKAQRDEEARLAAEKAAEEQGQFKELAEQRADELKTVTGERDGYKARLDQALTLLAASVNERWQDVPAEVAELYEGDADDPLAKTAFIEKNAKLIAKLNGQQTATEQRFAAASRTRTPAPDHTGRPDADEKVAKAFSRRYQ